MIKKIKIGKKMGLDDLTTEEIIEEIKKKDATYLKGAYLFYEGKKLSTHTIFKRFNIQVNASNNKHNTNKNVYSKLLSIIDELNKNQIYLKLPQATQEEYLSKTEDSNKIRYKEQLQHLPNEEENIKLKEKISMTIPPLNQILYGPPGTGKTYNTINKAIEIIENRKVADNEDREELKKQFNEYRDNGQIEFVTFHQSYGYEEFVEGIRADVESEEISYSLEDGIFKRLVSKAIRLKKIKNIEDIDFKDYLEIGQKFQTMTNLEFEISEIGNIIKIKRENNIISIGRDKILDYLKVQDFDNTRGHYSYQPIVAKYIFDQLNKNSLEDNTNKNYILIIDEINRGNISKIFGELITLIEPSKRLGADEELRLTLPNSKQSFGVPSNLYIIGTMNTADRSIAQIDTALRRRFEFVEMMPKPELIVDENSKPIVIDDIDVQKVLEAINERIEYIYDREHTIGHSYFMPLIKEPTKKKLDEIFEVNIIPLLAEYFYGDWADIIEVLNDNGFVIEKKLTYTPKTNRGNKVYQINKDFTVKSYQEIYKQK